MNTSSSSNRTALQVEHHTGFAVTKVAGERLCEYHLTFWQQLGEPIATMFWRLDHFLREHQATIVRQEIFGAIDAFEPALAHMTRSIGEVAWPVTWIEGLSCFGGPIAGMHVLAISGVDVDTVRLHDRPVGRAYHDGLATHLLLGGIYPADLSASKPEQAKQAFEQLEIALAQFGLGMASLARTWLFIDDILSWYGPFNVVRKELFETKNLFANLLPASTGVGVKNPLGAALVLGAWAVEPRSGPLTVKELPSPLQCAAPQYGSCFSRAIEFVSPDLRRMIISGTASIGPNGDTVCVGDLEGQIEKTMEVINALLASRNMDLSHVTRATAYFKNIEDAPAFSAWFHPAQPALPTVVVQADVCRDELLFELELDAIVPITPSPATAARGRTQTGLAVT